MQSSPLTTRLHESGTGEQMYNRVRASSPPPGGTIMRNGGQPSHSSSTGLEYRPRVPASSTGLEYRPRVPACPSMMPIPGSVARGAGGIGLFSPTLNMNSRRARRASMELLATGCGKDLTSYCSKREERIAVWHLQLFRGRHRVVMHTSWRFPRTVAKAIMSPLCFCTAVNPRDPPRVPGGNAVLPQASVTTKSLRIPALREVFCICSIRLLRLTPA
jgi:hypothetical protein